jgi:hypothetical protein
VNLWQTFGLLPEASHCHTFFSISLDILLLKDIC